HSGIQSQGGTRRLYEWGGYLLTRRIPSRHAVGTTRRDGGRRAARGPSAGSRGPPSHPGVTAHRFPEGGRENRSGRSGEGGPDVDGQGPGGVGRGGQGAVVLAGAQVEHPVRPPVGGELGLLRGEQDGTAPGGADPFDQPLDLLPRRDVGAVARLTGPPLTRGTAARPLRHVLARVGLLLAAR